MIYLIITVWLALGIHSACYLVKQYTKTFDFTQSEIPMLILCVLFPIATHLMTYLVYGSINKKSKVLFKRK